MKSDKWYIDNTSFQLEDFRNIKVDSVLEPTFVILYVNFQKDYFNEYQLTIAYNRFIIPKMVRIGFVDNGSSYRATTFERVDKVEDIPSVLPDINIRIMEEIKRVEISISILICKHFGV